MEQLSIRDWMVIIGGMMIAAVLIDAVRRYWRERSAEIRLNTKIGKVGSSPDEEDAFNLLTELPNGGARIVRRDDLQDDDVVVERQEVVTAESEEQSAGGGSLLRPLIPVMSQRLNLQLRKIIRVKRVQMLIRRPSRHRRKQKTVNS